jgi:cyclophilin family peptidyl-prolyl cis-trans isomerase
MIDPKPYGSEGPVFLSKRRPFMHRMLFLSMACLLIPFVCSQCFSGDSEKQGSTSEKPLVLVKTSMGDIKIELWPDKAPVTVKNFLRYVDEGFFDGLTFHRVVPGFVIQGGGFSPDMQQKPTYQPIKNEAAGDVKNLRGTLSMARTPVVDSATSQFFINLKDNDFLDHKDETPGGFGYAVFGKVVEGMDVVDRIAAVKTANKGPHQNVPVEPVVMEEAKQVKAE